MTRCCPHSEEEHHLHSTCQEVTHYPSEDYPCLCSGLVASPDGTCAACDHKQTSHVTVRVCRPTSGERCDCGTNGG